MSDILCTTSSSKPAPQEKSLLDDDPIFNDENFLAAVATLGDAFTKTSNAYPISSPNWDLLTPTPNTQPDQEKTLLDNVIEESKPEVEDVQYRKIEQRKFKNLPLSLRSPYWTKYNQMLSNVTEKEKLLSDYAFMLPSDEHPKEYVFK
nr:uncharacterized protein LOC109162426 [Ipomoea trifida]GMD19185.1 uncharacterized protein LOC109162426 [Ipomoea batatas]